MKRTVTVVGSASVSVEPDCARLQCGVQVAGSNAQDALRRSNSAMQSILATVREHGVSAADLRTNGPNLYPTDDGYSGWATTSWPGTWGSTGWWRTRPRPGRPGAG
jgi:uncharacterized protein YggE